MKRKGDSGQKIAHYLGRSVSTLRREWFASYPYHQAHARSVWRQQVKPRFHILTEELKARGVCGLQAGWSPEQIRGRWRQRHESSVSAVTLYRWIWQDRRTGGCLYRMLRSGGRRYRHRYGRCD